MARTAGLQFLGGLAAVLAIFLASSATAAPAVGSGPVRGELRQAEEALDHVWQEADDEDGEDTYDLDAVAANLAHTEAAHELALKAGRRSRAPLLAAVNDQADENVFEYADDAAWAPAEQQATLAAALATSVSVRSSVTAAMLARAERLSPGARAAVVRSITDALSDGDPDTLLEDLSEEDGATDATKASLAPSLARILADSDGTLADLERLAARLERAERDRVARAIDEIRESLDELPDWVDELFADIADFANDPEAAARSFCGFLSGLPLPHPSACG